MRWVCGLGPAWLLGWVGASSSKRANDQRRRPPCSDAVMATSGPKQAAQKLPKTGSPPCACQVTTIAPASGLSLNNQLHSCTHSSKRV